MNYVSKFSASATGRYIRYEIPAGAPNNEYNKDNVYNCNIAEIEVYGTPSKLADLNKIEIPTASVTGSASWRDSSNDFTKAFDGDINSFFDGLESGWVQADLGAVYDIDTIGFSPRKAYEARCTDGLPSVHHTSSRTAPISSSVSDGET